MRRFIFYNDAKFLTTHHYINSQNTIIFFEDIDFWPKIYLIYNPILGNLTTHFSIQGKNATPNAQKFLNRSCNIGDWFVLYQLRKNTDKQFFCQLLDKLGKDFNPAKVQTQPSVQTQISTVPLYDNKAVETEMKVLESAPPIPMKT